MMNRKNVSWAIAFMLAMIVASHDCHASDLSGSWSGYWVSCKSGHKGPLKATICKVDETHYSAKFKGRFLKVLPFRYSVTLRVVEDGEIVRLEGSSYLGRIMGTFSYTAIVSGNNVDAAYRSCKDHGKWVMTRCCSSGK